VSVVRQESGRDGGAHASALGTVSDSFRVAGRDCNDGDFLLRQLLRPRGREIGEEVSTGGGIVKDGPLFLRGESVGHWKKEKDEYVHSCAKPTRRTQAGFRYSCNQFPASRRQVRMTAKIKRWMSAALRDLCSARRLPTNASEGTAMRASVVSSLKRGVGQEIKTDVDIGNGNAERFEGVEGKSELSVCSLETLVGGDRSRRRKRPTFERLHNSLRCEHHTLGRMRFPKRPV
jgi:hypothetical protein